MDVLAIKFGLLNAFADVIFQNNGRINATVFIVVLKKDWGVANFFLEKGQLYHSFVEMLATWPSSHDNSIQNVMRFENISIKSH